MLTEASALNGHVHRPLSSKTMFCEHIKGEGSVNGSPHTIMPIESGKRYVFINQQSGTALDLDTGSSTVQGWSRHGGPNQQVGFIIFPSLLAF